MAWRSDGEAFVTGRHRWAVSGSAPYDIALRRFRLSGSSGFAEVGTPVLIAAAYPRGIFWDPEMTKVRSTEAQYGSACNVKVRNAVDLSTVLQTISSCNYFPTTGPSTVADAAEDGQPTDRMRHLDIFGRPVRPRVTP